MKTALGKRWVSAGDPARHDSIVVPIPFAERGFFPAAEPQARFYRFDAKEGQFVTAIGIIKTRGKSILFMDLLSMSTGQWKIIAHADSSLVLKKELTKNETLLIRIQPELLTDVYYSITITAGPALIIPVKGATNKDIGSFFDDQRTISGKKVKHEGVDIFAKKGTYVIAPTDGVVSRVGTNTLGGKVIWLKDSNRSPSYYFAHLDSQMVSSGTVVRQGDILGTVGNTGNAKFTPAHLHFGVYDNAPLDPLPYIRGSLTQSEFLPDTTFRSAIFRVNQKSLLLQSGPSKKLSAGRTLAKGSWLRVIAQSNDWYRVTTADNHEGYAEASKLVPANTGIKIVLKKMVSLLTEPRSDAIGMMDISGVVQEFASFKSFRYVKIPSGQTGWINLAQGL